MTRLLVGLVGRKRSGKDTFAARLVAAHGYTRLAFADPLKDAVLAADPYVTYRFSGGMTRLSRLVDSLGWELVKDQYPEVRRLLQTYGTAIRAIDPEFWVRALARRADAVDGPLVVTDVRFPNEVDMIRARGGVLVRIQRPNTDGGDPTSRHISETALADVEADHVVMNDGTLFDLRNAADELVKKL